MKMPRALAIAAVLICGTAVATPLPVRLQLGPASCTTGFTPSPAMFDSTELRATYTCTDNYATSGGCDGGLIADWEGPKAHAYVVNGVVRMIYTCHFSGTSYPTNGLGCGNQPVFSKVQDSYSGEFECASVPLTCSAPLVASISKAGPIPDTFFYTCRHVRRT